MMLRRTLDSLSHLKGIFSQHGKLGTIEGGMPKWRTAGNLTCGVTRVVYNSDILVDNEGRSRENKFPGSETTLIEGEFAMAKKAHKKVVKKKASKKRGKKK